MPLPRLDRHHAPDAPPEHPVRVVQFGTGALLRGLVDDAFDLANRAGSWDGRAVVVSQTGSGRGVAFNEQDGLYTLVVRGIEDGEAVERTRVVGAVARALSAQDDWDDVLALARDENVGLVVSNTTEVGLTWDEEDDPEAAPPRSFPAKLAAWLRARQEALGDGAGVVVLPTELVEGNGERLCSLVLRWGERAGWGETFAAFVRNDCTFTNTLVDRIVPGEPEDAEALQESLGYRDDLLTAAEVYRLWAIEGNDDLAERLPFADGAEPGVIVVPSVEPYRLRKVRLLNAAHTLLVPVALGCGCATVREAVEGERVGAFVRRLLFGELVPATERELEAAGHDPLIAAPFARAVLERFANPFIRHDLVSITLQQTMKLDVRAVPAVRALAETGTVPEAVALGFAAFLLLHRAATGMESDSPLVFAATDLLTDDRADAVRESWRRRPDAAAVVAHSVLADRTLWSDNLTDLPGVGSAFADTVARFTEQGLDRGVPMLLDALPNRRKGERARGREGEEE
ncbi:MAG: tagaturonate reductase [Bacteroidota bacterium]